MNKFSALLFLSTLILSGPVHAQEQSTEKPPSFTPDIFTHNYAPEYCDFIARFPEPPMTARHCEDDNNPETCFELATYTKVFDLSSSVKVQIICNPATPEMYTHFTQEVMEATVRAMTKESVVNEFTMNSRQEDAYRQSGLVASGKEGLYETLYIAQLWISETSIMSVEATLSGAQTPESDALFANLLRNIGYKPEIAPPSPEPSE